jgi:carbonic anhydrase
MQGAPEALAAYFGVGTSELADQAVADPHAAVAVDVAVLRARPGIADTYVVTGLVYDVATGLVEVVVPADVVPA